MLGIPHLDDDHVAGFERDGYAILRRAFTAEDLRRIEAWTREIAERPEVSGRHWVFHERSRLDPNVELISRIERMSPFHAGFAELARVLAVPVARLLGEPALLFKEKVNYKMPGGDGFKPHQDSQAGWDAYADYFVSVMVCVDEATVANGCLQLVAGHQHRGLFRAWEPLSEQDMQGMRFEPCPTRPGDAVFFDCYTPHASEPNLTDNTRRLYFATYNRRSAGEQMERYYADKHRSYPPDIDRRPGQEYVFRV